MPPTPPISTLKKEKILIIETDGSLGERISEALHKDGYTVNLIKNGPEGLKGIYDLPHLVLMDVDLAGADSYGILMEKQAEPMLADIPIFLISAQGVPIDMRRIPQNGVADFLISLHMEPAEIVTRVNRYFKHEPVPGKIFSSSDASAKKILWVEDDKLIGTILSKKLIDSGFNLFHTKNGQDALVALKQTMPDAIILDLVLPNMSGFDILQEIKKDQRLAKVPVMILSNLSKQSDIERAKILGAQRFLVKAAVSLDQIVSEVRGLCK
jgi:DNA-binding response OmpR family regulator